MGINYEVTDNSDPMSIYPAMFPTLRINQNFVTETCRKMESEYAFKNCLSSVPIRNRFSATPPISGNKPGFALSTVSPIQTEIKPKVPQTSPQTHPDLKTDPEKPSQPENRPNVNSPQQNPKTKPVNPSIDFESGKYPDLSNKNSKRFRKSSTHFTSYIYIAVLMAAVYLLEILLIYLQYQKSLKTQMEILISQIEKDLHDEHELSSIDVFS